MRGNPPPGAERDHQDALTTLAPLEPLTVSSPSRRTQSEPLSKESNGPSSLSSISRRTRSPELREPYRGAHAVLRIRGEMADTDQLVNQPYAYPDNQPLRLSGPSRLRQTTI